VGARRENDRKSRLIGVARDVLRRRAMHRSMPLFALGLLAGASLAGVALIRFQAAHAAPLPRLSLPVPGEARATAPASSGCLDEDGDGYGEGCAKGPDCNDLDAKVHPGAAESCDGRDEDCNTRVDDAPICTAPALQSPRVPVPAGSFDMGSAAGAADEAPVHRVRGGAFSMDRYEVTNARYAACVSAGACSKPALTGSKLRAKYYDEPEFADYPVIFVAWSQADAFCKWSGGRLPTEAEWERAARGTEGGHTYPWGEAQPDCSKANFGGCAGDTDRVGRREAGASPYGAMDLAGNVWEWTADWYDAGYYARLSQASGAAGVTDDPRGPGDGKLKVMRGGCWVSGASSLRTTCRKAELPASWAPNVGFRCVYGGAS
jgi:formylglycine-generating enzyme required for sulfatase activity